MERLCKRTAQAWLEQQSVAVRAHLGVDLLSVDHVHPCLDIADRHTGVEDDHVRAEVRHAWGERGACRTQLGSSSTGRHDQGELPRFSPVT